MLLAIDSATAACSVALVEGGEVVAERHELVGRGHAERLVPMVAELLAELLAEVPGGRRPDSILVDCGPGSFTGIRVGLAAAHGMAIGWGIEVRGYSSMALIAAGAGADASQAGAQIAVALQGGHGELFVQSYCGDPLAPLDALRSLTPDAAAAAIEARFVVGSGAEALVAARGNGEWRDGLPRAADILLLPETLRDLEPRPIYGRAADAKPVQSDAAGGVEGPMT
jgi:tRNA threonylcarbamoyladenosine biosynthesis protein TsaB